MDITVFFSEAARLGASDLHITPGHPPTFRVAGKLLQLSQVAPITAQQATELLLPLLNPEQKDLFLNNRELDLTISSQFGRFRTNLYFQRGVLSGTFRLIQSKIRNIEELGLPHICYEFAKLHQGFILVTGPTGHGKSTTLAAMIQEINQAQQRHIITIEDPIEYIYPPGQSIITQREMHADTHSWSVALRSVLRQDPDVVLIGEMRDFETIQAALTTAETGHLVFATLHTNSASQTIDRIVGVFPDSQQPQIRLQLSATIEAVISQRLIPALGGGRAVATEVLIATPAVKATIREGKTHLIDNVMQTSAEAGMITLEMSLSRLVKEGKISVDTAMAYSLRPEEIARLLKLENK